jgi:hypothetical protein
MTTTTVRNGIDVDQLMQTIEATQNDEAVGTFTFRASSRWEDGPCNVGRIHTFEHAGEQDSSRGASFVLHGDEPPVLLGQNRGPNAGRVSGPNASADQLTELCQYVQDTSPVRDILANPVPVKTSLEIT